MATATRDQKDAAMDVEHMVKGTVILDDDEALTTGVETVNHLVHAHDEVAHDDDVVYRVYRMRWSVTLAAFRTL